MDFVNNQNIAMGPAYIFDNANYVNEFETGKHYWEHFILNIKMKHVYPLDLV